MKVIIIDTPNGQFYVPLKIVAEQRADYYACEVDGYSKDSEEWKEEVEYAMSDTYEGIDWILNNTNWEEWAEHAVRLNKKVLVTEDDFWTSSENFEISEI